MGNVLYIDFIYLFVLLLLVFVHDAVVVNCVSHKGIICIY
jgi:hypothetical protein